MLNSFVQALNVRVSSYRPSSASFSVSLMGFHCRKLLHQYQYEHTIACGPAPAPAPSPSPHPLPLLLPITPRIPFLPPDDQGLHINLVQVGMIVMACTVGFVMFLCTVSIIRRKYYSRRHNHSHNHMRGHTPILFHVNGDSPVSASDADDDEGPFIDHPIWFIRTVGLQQSVIDSITVFIYRKDEGLIDGTECSVCLAEFQEDERLRLLPKCSHAFHIPCIDSWLRSHTNCPLCRAPVVHDAGGGSGSGTEVRAAEPDSNVSGENQVTTQVENFDDGVGNHHVGESESSSMRIGGDHRGEDGGASGETPDKMLPNFDKMICHASILTGSHEVEEEDIQRMRRSVSMDSCTASITFRDVVDLNFDREGSDTQLGDKIDPSSKDMITSAKQSSGSSSSAICKLASIGRALQKRPISLRSSFSHNRKSLSSRHCRSQSSTLPL